MLWQYDVVSGAFVEQSNIYTDSLLAAPRLGTAQDEDDSGSPEHRAQEARAKAAMYARMAKAGHAWIQDQSALPIDVTFYDLKLALDPNTRVVRGDVRIAARMGPVSGTHVRLDLAAPMLVDSVHADGMLAAFVHTDDDLTVDLGRFLTPGQPFEVRVFYGGTPDAASALHFDTRSGQPLVWTLSEPFGSRTWWPCQDTPADKADSVAIDLTVPSALTAVSNGKLGRTTANGSTTTFHWRESYPITPYLVSIAAHPYTALTTSYTPIAGGTLPVTLSGLPGPSRADRIVSPVGRLVRSRCPIAFGLAIVENAYDQTAAVEAVAPEDFEARERELLVLACRWMPRLPLDEIDLLIVDEMGKNISGQGMDTTVIGRKVVRSAGMPMVTRLFVRELTAASHGNAHGLGNADFTTTRLVRAIDPKATRLNSMTATNPQGARVPIAFDTDREAIDAVLSTIGLTPPEFARIVRIRNTLKLEVVAASEPCLEALRGRRDVEPLTATAPMRFNAGGNLLPSQCGAGR